MRKGGADTAAVEIDHAPVLPAGEDDAAAEGMPAPRADQPRAQRQIQTIASRGKMRQQSSTRGITEAQFFDQHGVPQTAPVEIPDRLRMAVELRLVEGRRVIQDRGSGRGRELLPQLLDTLAEGKMQSQFDQADQVASTPAALRRARLRK